MIYFLFFVAVFTLYFEEEVKKCAFEIYKFVEFIHENNPLLLNYYDYENEEENLEFYNSNKEELKEQEEELKEQGEQLVELYENKYLTKFKNFTDEYSFNERDLEYEKNKFDKLFNFYKSLMTSLEHQVHCYTVNLNQLVEFEEELKKELAEKYPNGEMEKLEDENDDTDFNVEVCDDYDRLYYSREKITNQRYKLEKISNELAILKEKTEEELKCEIRQQAHTDMIENKLNEFMNNYIIEYTPIGNVVMRFNNNKKSFEYYSNNSVPYRYLEPIGRKYVLTYNCKDIFIDMDEEVEKVNKLNETKKNEQNKNNKQIGKQQTLKFQQTLANKKMDIPSNRTGQTIINPINNVDIAIKDSNRYTWEGRFGDFKIIKSEKSHDKNNISFKEFKKRQQNNN